MLKTASSTPETLLWSVFLGQPVWCLRGYRGELTLRHAEGKIVSESVAGYVKGRGWSTPVARGGSGGVVASLIHASARTR